MAVNDGLGSMQKEVTIHIIIIFLGWEWQSLDCDIRYLNLSTKNMLYLIPSSKCLADYIISHTELLGIRSPEFLCNDQNIQRKLSIFKICLKNKAVTQICTSATISSTAHHLSSCRFQQSKG
jgi:hypothetical protein